MTGCGADAESTPLVDEHSPEAEEIEWATPPPPPREVSRDEPSLQGVRWEMPAVFERRATNEIDRYASAEYRAGRAVLTVHYRPLSDTYPIGRVARDWEREMRPRSGQPSFETRTIHGLPVATVDVRGTFTTGTVSYNPAPGQRLLGAAVDGPRGQILFKLLGPIEVVHELEEAFETIVSSLEAM